MSGPDFMVIGADEAGTTWLDRNLRPHPELWLPPETELHFFDRPRRDDPWRKAVLANAEAAGPPQADLDWLRRFAAVDTSKLDEYGALFAPKPGQLAGDLTAAYAMLDERVVAGISRAYPALRIVFAMRDPVDRLWSDYNEQLKPDDSEMPPQDEARFRQYLDGVQPFLRTEYRRTLSIWRKWFGRGAVLPVFFDEIETNPHHLVERILEHVGTQDRTPPNADLLTQKTFAGEKAYVPDVFAALVAERFLPMLLLMSREFGDPAERWFARAQAAFRDHQLRGGLQGRM